MGVACCTAGSTVVFHDHEVDWRKRRAIAFKKNLLSHVVTGNGDSNSMSDGYLFFAPPTRWHFLAALHRQQRTHDLAAQAQRRRQQRTSSPDNSRLPTTDIVSSTSKGSGKVVAFAEDSKSAVHDFSPSIDTAVEMPTDAWCYLVHASQYLPVIVDPNAPGSSVTVDHGHLRADGTVDASKMRRRSSRRFSKRKSQQGSVNSRNHLGADSAANILVNSAAATSTAEASASSHPAYRQDEEEFSDDGGSSTCDSNTMMVRGAGGGGEYLYLSDAKLPTTAKKKGASEARLLAFFDGKPLMQNTLTERHHQHVSASSDAVGGDGLGLFAFSGGRFSELAAANQALVRIVGYALWMAAPLHTTVPNTSSDLLLPTTRSSTSQPDEGRDDSTRVVSKGPSTIEKQEKALLTCMSPLDLFLMHPSSYFDSAHYEAAVSGRGLAQGPSRVAVGEVPAVALHINSFAMECQHHHQDTITAAQSHHEAPRVRRSAMAKRERCGAAARSLLQRALGASLSVEGGGGDTSGTKDLALSCFTKAATRRQLMKSSPLPPSSSAMGQSRNVSVSGQSPPSTSGMKGLVAELASTKADTSTSIQPPAVLFASAGLASTPRHPLAPALTALTTSSILPTNIPSLESMDAWLSSIGTTKPLSHRTTNQFTSSPRHHHQYQDSSHPSPTTFLSAPAVVDLSTAVQQLWRGAIGTGHSPSGSDSQYERATESTRQQSFATTPLSGSNFNTEDMHVPDEDGPPLTPPTNKGPRVQRINSDSTTIPQHPPQRTPLRTTIQSKGTLGLSLGVSTTFVRLGCRRGVGSSTPSAAYEGEGGGGWGTPRRHSQHSTTSPDESQWGTPKARRRRSLIPRPSTTIMISSPAQEDGSGGVGVDMEEAHVSPPVFMAPSPPAAAVLSSSSCSMDHPTNGIEGVSLLLQTLTMATM